MRSHLTIFFNYQPPPHSHPRPPKKKKQNHHTLLETQAILYSSTFARIFFKNYFLPSTAIEWNKLATDLPNSVSYSTFKINILMF